MRASVQRARIIEVFGCETVECKGAVRNRRRTRRESTRMQTRGSRRQGR